MEFEKYSGIFNKLGGKEGADLALHVNSILQDAWGEFPSDFMEKHVFRSGNIVLAKENSEYLGFCCISVKTILGKKVDYVEFLVIKKVFQNKNAGSRLLGFALRSLIIKNIGKLLFSPLEIMFITPNIRVLTWTAKFAKFVYPNPFSADAIGKIMPADEVTWEMARDLIKQSDAPGRKLHREGLVLEDSYQNTPWLIYDIENIPWSGHADTKIHAFTERYLNYKQGEGKEFVVRAQIGFLSIIKYLTFLASK